MEDNNYRQAVVIDNGSGVCKVGFAEDSAPISVFPAVVGYHKGRQVILINQHRDFYVGEEAEQKRGALQLVHPVHHGHIVSWQDMSKLWHHCYDNQLKVNPEEQPCLLTQAPKSLGANRIKTAEIMFEEFRVPALYIANQAALSLCSLGKKTGLALESGDGVTYAVPIVDGTVVGDAVQINQFAGRDLTEYLAKLMNELGLSFITSAEMEIVRDMKQTICQVASSARQLEAAISERSSSVISYRLPDNTKLEIGLQRFRCPQALFQGKLIGREGPSLDQLITQSISRCDIHTHKQLYQNIVLSGGTTMFPGLPQRLAKEVKQSLSKRHSDMKVKIEAIPERKYLTWIGGSIIASLETFQNMWVDKAEYMDRGASQIAFRNLL